MPAPLAVTVPPLTVATDEEPLLQVAEEVTSLLSDRIPLRYVLYVALAVVFSPTLMLLSLRETLRLYVSASLTLTVWAAL